jgi:hypothetical protein
MPIVKWQNSTMLSTYKSFLLQLRRPAKLTLRVRNSELLNWNSVTIIRPVPRRIGSRAYNLCSLSFFPCTDDLAVNITAWQKLHGISYFCSIIGLCYCHHLHISMAERSNEAKGFLGEQVIS